MTIERNHEGIVVSDIVNGYRLQKLFIGYTVKEAKREFKTETSKKFKESFLFQKVKF